MPPIAGPAGNQSRARLPVLAALVLFILLAGATPLGGQERSGATASPDPPTVRTSLPRDRAIPRDEPIVLEFSRPFDPVRERAVVFFGTTDVTALLESTPAGLRYGAGVLALPVGENDVVVYLVTAEGWREIGREPMKVVGRLGVETTRLKPKLDLGVKSRLDSRREPALPAPDRETYHDFDGQFGLESEVVRLGGASILTRTAMVGTSHRESSLRFRDLGEAAPLVDLSSYLVQLQQGGLRLAVGHVAAGSQRHLIDRFTSRGTTLAYSAGSRLDASVAALHGSNLVGWSDLFGITEPDHRLLNATLGVEALARPGALRVELSALDGSILPRSGFNQGAVTDAEQSRGMAVRVHATGLDRRLRLDGGFSRSAFDNPPDPLLAQGAALVPVEERARHARYLDTSLDILRGLRLGARRSARMSLTLAHERVDPLFRTVAAYTRADQLQNKLELRGDVAGVAFGASHVRSENNLDEVASILKTLTRRTSIDVRIPVATVLGARPSGWWPSLRYRLDHTHQFGAAVPGAGGFDPSHVPDQASDNRTLGADWRWGKATFGYQHNRSFQDNRQPGREKADLETVSNGATASLTPVRALSLSANFSVDAAENLEREETDRTRKYGLGGTWQPLRGSSLAVQLSDTDRQDDSRGSTRRDRSLSAQWSSPVPGLARFGGKWYLRYATTTNEALDPTFGLDQRREEWSLDSGLSFRFF